MWRSTNGTLGLLHHSCHTRAAKPSNIMIIDKKCPMLTICSVDHWTKAYHHVRQSKSHSTDHTIIGTNCLLAALGQITMVWCMHATSNANTFLGLLPLSLSTIKIRCATPNCYLFSSSNMEFLWYSLRAYFLWSKSIVSPYDHSKGYTFNNALITPGWCTI